MASFEIHGGKPLKGEVTPQGAKNEALQVLCAVLLTEEKVTISNIPDIIDVNKLWRAIYNSGARTIVIEDMTFKQGKNVSWNGGLIYNNNGTMTFNRIKISNHSSWAFYQGGGGVTTFNDSQFNWLIVNSIWYFVFFQFGDS